MQTVCVDMRLGLRRRLPGRLCGWNRGCTNFLGQSTAHYVIICVVIFSLSNVQADLRPSTH